MENNIETIVGKKEKDRLYRIMEFAKSLDEKGQDAFINVLIGFNMAQNLKLVKNIEN